MVRKNVLCLRMFSSSSVRSVVYLLPLITFRFNLLQTIYETRDCPLNTHGLSPNYDMCMNGSTRGFQLHWASFSPSQASCIWAANVKTGWLNPLGPTAPTSSLNWQPDCLEIGRSFTIYIFFGKCVEDSPGSCSHSHLPPDPAELYPYPVHRCPSSVCKMRYVHI